MINTFYGMIATNKNQSASSKDAGHFRGSNYHKLGCGDSRIIPELSPEQKEK